MTIDRFYDATPGTNSTLLRLGPVVSIFVTEE